MLDLKKTAIGIALFTLAAFPGMAVAGAVGEKGPNGGLLRESGDHHIELIVKGQSLTVHLLDHQSKPTKEAGVTGLATVTAGKAVESVTLTAQAGGVFVGTGKFPAAGKLQVDIVLSPPNEPPLSASFEVTQ